MKTSIQVFKEGQGPEIKDYDKLIKIIEKLNKKLVQLNEKLLFLNRNQRRKLDLHEVNLKDLIEDIVENLEFKSKKNGVEVKTNLNDVRFKSDSEQLSIAIQNLIDNAIKYCNKKKDGVVKVDLRSNKKQIIISVSDNGLGIPVKDQKKIFDRFYRGSNAFKIDADGEGLGLSIVKKIVEAHGGEVGVESKVGKGSAFKIKLPVNNNQ